MRPSRGRIRLWPRSVLRQCLLLGLLLWTAVVFLSVARNVSNQATKPPPSASPAAIQDQPTVIASEETSKEPPVACHRYPWCARVTHLPTGANGECEFDLTNHTQYLPDPRLVECVRRTRTRFAIDAESYQQRVATLQSPERCDAPRSELRDDRWHVLKFTSHGHGVNAFYMAILAGNHWDRGIPVLASPSAYRFGSHAEVCEGKDRLMRGWSCHMSPLSPRCSLQDEDTLKAAVNVNKNDIPHRPEEWCKPHGEYDILIGRCKCEVGYLPSEDGSHCLEFDTDFKDKSKWRPRYKKYHEDDDYASTGTEHWVSRLAPGEVFAAENMHDPAHVHIERFQRKHRSASISTLKLKYGFFYWMLTNVWILHKDAPKRAEMEARVMRVLQRPNDGAERRRCAAVHVRRGDSCDDPTARHRTCPKLEVYAKHALEMKRLYHSHGPLRVFLASDDPTAIAEAKAINEAMKDELEFVWQDIDRKRYVNGKVVDNNPDLFSDAAMDELYFDLWAISLCDVGFVASFASSVAWNAYGLLVGRLGYYVPFVSVDWPWGHRILGGHHAKNNLFDTTLDSGDLSRRMKLFN